MIRAYMIAVTISALIWALVAAVLFTTFSGDESDLMNYVRNMSPAAHDEMCEVWSQDRLAVVNSLRVLSGSSIEDASLVASFTCDQ